MKELLKHSHELEEQLQREYSSHPGSFRAQRI